MKLGIALAAGVLLLASPAFAQEWRPINTAPHDGTVIEIKNTYGVAPWYGLFQWTNKEQIGGPQDQTKECDGSPSPYELYPQHKLMGFTWGGFTDAQWDDWVTHHCRDRKIETFTEATPRWHGVGPDTGSGVGCSDVTTCWWRPYQGDTSHYSDPTNGAQNTESYWIDAVNR